MRLARRVQNLPPYLFAELDRKVAAKRAAGADVISLGVGDPDLPTPPHVVEALRQAAVDPATHRYPSYYGMPEFRDAIASWYRRRFGVSLDPAPSDGARLSEIRPGTPAEKVGLQVGDVITSFAGTKITSSDALSHLVDTKAPGDTVTVTFVRGGKSRTVTVTLASRPS